MHTHGSRQIAHVESWLEGAAHDPSAPQLITLLERALGALWQAALVTLGEVTLAAIVDRVLFTASERYPFVSITQTEGAATSFHVLQLGAVQHDRRLREVMCFVLAEFLGVLGNLTDEILTPSLHAALASVRSDEAERLDPDRDAEGGTR
jgi:hypothetical protein